VETGDDTTHPITQIGKVPLSMQDGRTKYLKDVFHVPTITVIVKLFNCYVTETRLDGGTRFTGDIQP
jgi:hypothetical protein